MNIIFLNSVVSSQAPSGIFERFKIINCNKIPCTVKFAILPAAGPRDNDSAIQETSKSKKGKGKAAGGGEGGGLPSEVSCSVFE